MSFNMNNHDNCTNKLAFEADFTNKNQDEFIDYKDIYVNHTGDWALDTRSFIHNTCELVFVEQGEADYEINGVTYSVKPRSVIIIGATDFHISRITKVPYVRYGLYFLPRYIASLPMIREYLDVYSTPTPEEAQHLFELPEETFGELCHLIRRFYHERENACETSGDMQKALTWEMTLMLGHLLKKRRVDQYNHSQYSTMLNIRSFIDANYSEDCGLTRLSNEFFMHPDTISRLFSRYFNTTLKNYISLVRISAAVRLLTQTEESITEIANHVGYNNINTFIRAFTKVMQMAPLQYRKANTAAVQTCKPMTIE